MVGRETAEYVQGLDKFDVFGYDISERALRSTSLHSASSVWDMLPPCEFYIVCVNTWWRNESPDMSAVIDVCQRVAKTSPGSLVSIESTLAVGTSRMISKLLNLDIIHVPHRLWPENMEEHGVRQTRVFGAVDEKSKARGVDFYDRLDIPLVKLDRIESAEFVKLVENSYRYVQLAFTEEIAVLCESVGLTFPEIKKGVNSKWNAELFEPRDGIGGTCLPKDIRFLKSMIQSLPLIEGALRTDDTYRLLVSPNKERHHITQIEIPIVSVEDFQQLVVPLNDTAD